jgi:DNA modification methylase
VNKPAKTRLTPGGGGGAWLGGPKTASTDNYAAPKAIGTTGWMNDKGLTGGCSDGEPGVASGTSIFDPVLTELCYRWFCPPSGVILDPFAGGSVRGIVASVLGYQYHGFELSPTQVAANLMQGADICPDKPPLWYTGDSLVAVPQWQGSADFIFSCPPYGNLEIYSDAPDDLSAMPHDDFIVAYRGIIAAAVDKLAPDSFACFVVGDFRDKNGFYRNFVGDTISAFIDAGAGYYNEAILVTAVGSLPIRVGRQFKSGRKLGKTHQNILVFCKGDPKKATDKIEGRT